MPLSDYFPPIYNTSFGSIGVDLFDGGDANERFLADGDAAFNYNYSYDWGYRFYLTAYGREPDPVAFLQWAKDPFGTLRYSFEPGDFIGPLPGVETSQLSNAEFVTLLYKNAFGADREVDAAGMARWTRELGEDPSTTDRAFVAFGIARSPELKAKTEDAPNELAYETVSYARGWSDQVYRLYQTVLGENPDARDMVNWVRIESQTDVDILLATTLMRHPIFDQVHDIDDPDFIADLYRTVLDREPDAGGAARWASTLQSEGAEAVFLGIANSPEFKAKAEADLKDWMRDQGSYGNSISAGGGDNLVAGGMFADTFVFEAGEAGTTIVMDLEAWDWIDLNGFGYTDAAQAKAQMTQDGVNLVFNDQEVEIVFYNTTLDDITNDMILI
ncbi:MAG: DUF4214 domain-containing protein [Pseudomonadota bacterium]